MKTLSRRKAKQCAKPWITKGIRTSIRLITSYIYLVMTLNINSIEIKSVVKHELVKSNISLNISRPTLIIWKKTWIGINNLLNCKNKRNKLICALKDFKNNNEVSRDPSCILNILNDHFATVGQTLANQLPSTAKCFTDFLGKCKSPVSSFFFQPITPAEIRLEILSIPNNKSHGLYSCPTRVLKCASDPLSQIVAESSIHLYH